MSTPTPLQAHHESAEAFFLNYGPPPQSTEHQPQTPIVETFGQLDMEYAALRKSTVLFDQPHFAILKVTGKDRHTFLNNMLTNKVDPLNPGQSINSFWLNRQGKIDADLRLIETQTQSETQSTTYIILDRHLAKTTADTLTKFVFAEDIQITIDNTLHLLTLHGPTTFKTLNTDPINENTNTTIKINTIEIITDRTDLTGEIGLNLLVPKNQLESIYTHLINQQAKPTGWLAINTARIEAGHPLYNIDFGPDSLPAETGILEKRVNLTKGCYLGQEVVARMHARNIRKQSIVALRLDDQRITTEDQSILQPLTGSHINLPDQQGQTPIGAITSSTISPMLGAIPICFAMLKDAHTKPGTKLSVWAEGKYADCTVADSLTFWPKPTN